MSDLTFADTGTAAVLVPLSALHPAPWNPRLIRDERFKNLVKSILADPGPGDVPEHPVTRLGDVIVLGCHRLLCGDSADAANALRLLASRMPAVVLSDPPYGMDLDTDYSTIKGSAKSIGKQHGINGNVYVRVEGDAAPFDPQPIFDLYQAPEMFLFGGDYYAERIPKRNDGSWLVWDKRQDNGSEDAIGSEFELIWSRRKHKRRVLRHEWFGFVSRDNQQEARSRQHPTQKPTSLLRDIMEQWTKPGDVVVDPYGGSGSTMIAGEQTGRDVYMAEISPAYCDVIIERWETATGMTATRT